METPIIIEHVAPNGEKYTQEIHSMSGGIGGGGCIEVVKDQYGRIVNTIGSGGCRPWDKR